jgi:hypothetical protein
VRLFFLSYDIFIMKKLALLLFPLLMIGTSVFSYSAQEQKEAYEWAYSKWITIQPLEKANFDWYITRQALSKMLIRFYEARWWEIVYISDPNACAFDDKDSIIEDLRPFVHAACELWYMWVWILNFNPMWTVTRAQFGTTLSRLMFWGHFDWGTPYYKKHLEGLKNSWIMDDISMPDVNEKRWDIMVMLKKANDVLDKEIDQLMWS